MLRLKLRSMLSCLALSRHQSPCLLERLGGHHQPFGQRMRMPTPSRVCNRDSADFKFSTARSSSSTIETQRFPLDASRLGLNPQHNQVHAPLVYHEQYSFHGWPEKHTFPMDKFARTAHALVTTCRATQPDCSSLTTSRPLVNQMQDFFRPLEMEDVLTKTSWLATSDNADDAVIDATFVRRFLDAELSTEECRRIGFREQTSRPELIERTVLEVAGTVLACQLAMNFGIAANVAGGTHHAHPSGGAGYTILNDLAVASHVMLTNTGVDRILVIDTDVHQGDGTAKFGAVEPLKDKMYTLSLHCTSNYPHPKAHSTYDVGLPDGMRDEEYLEVLQHYTTKVVEETQPDMIIYDAGVDVYEGDVLGRLQLTENGIRRRDFFVLDYCASQGIPVAAVVGGGYDNDVDALARRHAIVHEECARVWQKYKLWESAASLC